MGEIEHEMGVDEIVAETGASAAMVRKVMRMVDMSEYKRRQSPPGIQITSRAFGRDWRLPITNKFSS